MAASATYADLPSLLTIDEAVASGSFHSHDRLTSGVAGRRLARGDVDAAFEAAAAAEHVVVSGTARCGGQEHFYLEPNGSLVIPGEGDAVEVWSSTQARVCSVTVFYFCFFLRLLSLTPRQAPTEHQHAVAHVLRVPFNKVVVRVKRLGGGFGGKESRSAPIAAAAAVAAASLRRPVRLVLDRDEDMAWTGAWFMIFFSCSFF